MSSPKEGSLTAQLGMSEAFTKFMNTENYESADRILWFEILKRCDNNSLLRAELTCQFFHWILSSSQFWIEKCEYDGVTLPSVQWRKYLHEKGYSKSHNPYNNGETSPYAFDYKRICIGQPFGRNLAVTLTSSCTLDGLEHEGMRFEDDGDGIIIESPPQGIDPDEISVCFTTSYEWCSRYFEIDLNKTGVQVDLKVCLFENLLIQDLAHICHRGRCEEYCLHSAEVSKDWIMDQIRPKIIVRERCICRRDCPAVYELCVKLLKGDEEFDAISEDYEKRENSFYPRFRTAQRGWTEGEGKLWELVEYVFEDYPAGIRKIGVLSGGKDSRFLDGHYGSKFGATEVCIKLPDVPRLLALDEAVDAWTTYEDC